MWGRSRLLRSYFPRSLPSCSREKAPLCRFHGYAAFLTGDLPTEDGHRFYDDVAALAAASPGCGDWLLLLLLTRRRNLINESPSGLLIPISNLCQPLSEISCRSGSSSREAGVFFHPHPRAAY